MDKKGYISPTLVQRFHRKKTIDLLEIEKPKQSISSTDFLHSMVVLVILWKYFV